jgi:hypothetical protein
MSIGWPLLATLAVLLVVSVATSPFRDVTRRRLERFAWRQALPITVGNGPTVIRYLATTRRWRGSGLLVALMAAVAYDATLGREYAVHISGGEVFAGWFIGAVIAEWRISTPPVGVRRVASLNRRRLRDYVPRPIVAAAAAVWAIVLSAELLVAAGVLPRLPSAGGAPWLELMLTLIEGAAVVIVAWRVLTRPQPVAAPDILAADDALRSRSLYVLAGSALALGGYLGAQITAASGFAGPGSGYQLRDILEMVGVVVLPIAGAVLALSPRRRLVRARDISIAA